MIDDGIITCLRAAETVVITPTVLLSVIINAFSLEETVGRNGKERTAHIHLLSCGSVVRACVGRCFMSVM